jgi:hypothetical protein
MPSPALDQGCTSVVQGICVSSVMTHHAAAGAEPAPPHSQTTNPAHPWMPSIHTITWAAAGKWRRRQYSRLHAATSPAHSSRLAGAMVLQLILHPTQLAVLAWAAQHMRCPPVYQEQSDGRSGSANHFCKLTKTGSCTLTCLRRLLHSPANTKSLLLDPSVVIPSASRHGTTQTTCP